MTVSVAKRIERAQRDVIRYMRYVELNEAFGNHQQARHWQHSVYLAKRRVRMLEQLGKR